MKTAENIGRVNQLVWSDHKLMVQMIAEELRLKRESVRTILVQELGVQKVCTKMVPKLLLDDQEHLVNVYQDLQEKIGEEFLGHHRRRDLGLPESKDQGHADQEGSGPS